MKKSNVAFILILLIAVAVQGAISDPGDISGLYVRLEADSLALNHGTSVTSWTDSARGYEFTGTATYDAYYANGHAAVYFDGIADQLKNRGWTDGPSPADATLFVVGNFTTTGNDGESDWMISAQWPEGNSNNRFRLIKYKDNNDGQPAGRYQFRVGSASTVTFSETADTEQHVFALVSGQTANVVDFFIDGELLGSGNSGSVVNMQALGLGSNHRGGDLGTGNQFADCSIAEVLLYDHALTAQEVTDVTDYLQAKYAPMTVAQVNDGSGIDATLTWNTLAEPGNYPQVDSGLIRQYVYLSDDQTISTDPNLYYHGEGAIVSGLTSDYTAADLNYDSLYEAAVVFVMQGYDYTPTAGISRLMDIDPNNIIGPALKFTTESQIAQIDSISPAYTVVDQNGTAILTCDFTSGTAPTVKWFKSGDPDVEVAVGGDIAIDLTGPDVDGGYTSTLTVNHIEVADEGAYYCLVENASGPANAVASSSVNVGVKRIVGHWTFDLADFQNGLYLDSSDEGHNAEPNLIPDLSQFVTGADAAETNEGVDFTAKPLSVADTGDWAISTDTAQMTLSMWVNWAGSNGSWQGLVSNRLTPGEGNFYFEIRQDNGNIQLGTPYFTAGPLQGPNLPVGQWAHVAVTMEPAALVIYVNGQEVNRRSPVAGLASGIFPMYLGALDRSDAGILNAPFNGTFDDVRFYNYAKTATEIVDLYYAVSETPVCLNLLDLDLSFDVAGGGESGDEPDCQVSLPDFAEFASDWLNSGLYPETP